MVRDITIGQYYNTRSPIHELDARTKLVLTIVYAVTIFWCRDLWTFLAATAFLIVYVALSRVPLSFICRGLKVVWAFILFTAFFSLFNGDGRVLVSIWRFHITFRVPDHWFIDHDIYNASTGTYSRLGEVVWIPEDLPCSGIRYGLDAFNYASFYSDSDGRIGQNYESAAFAWSRF